MCMKIKWKILNALDLKLLAMALMLCDHLWATLFPYHQWLTDIGRLAFPIFAFQIVEGYCHTHDFRKYLLRMFLFALVSEIPFNLMTAGGLVNPFQQNVMFTFCIGLLMIRLLDYAKNKHWALYLLAVIGTAFLGFFLGMLTFVDYFGYGVLTVLVFYVFRDLPLGWLGILLSLLYIHNEMMGGLMYSVRVFGHPVEFYQQGLAVLALIPISMYNGKQGPHSKTIQYLSYGFYPAHMLIISLIWLAMA